MIIGVHGTSLNKGTIKPKPGAGSGKAEECLKCLLLVEGGRAGFKPAPKKTHKAGGMRKHRVIDHYTTVAIVSLYDAA